MSCARVNSDLQPEDDYEYYTRTGRENYNPNAPVCDNQADFNQAFHEAVKYNRKKEMNKDKPWMYVYVVLWLIFFVWAIVIAMKVSTGNDRTIHLVFAILFAPAYVLAYYLGMMDKGGMGNGMGFY